MTTQAEKDAAVALAKSKSAAAIDELSVLIPVSGAPVDPPVVTPPIVIPPTPPGTGALKLLAQHTMKAATNDGPDARTPFFGKHMASAYRPSERAMYLFGGDGTSWKGVGNTSGCFHFGKVVLGAKGSVPVFQHFYPYLGIAGQVVPAGYDCAPFTHDSKRDQFWQIGGYVGPVLSPPYVGIAEGKGVWTFKHIWAHVSKTTTQPGTPDEGMACIYVPRLDKLVGVWNSATWYYDCATVPAASVVVPIANFTGDDREIGVMNAIGYDESKDELLYLGTVSGDVIATKLTGYPTTKPTMRVIGKMQAPHGANGQFPAVWVPPRRELVCFYRDGDMAVARIDTINVDTGKVTSNPYPASVAATGAGFVTQAVYVPEDGNIVGIVGQSSDVVIFGWDGSPPVVIPPPVVTPPIVIPPGGLPAWASDANLPPGTAKAISLNTILEVATAAGVAWDLGPGGVGTGQGGIAKAVAAWTSGIDAPLLGANGSKVWAGGGDADGWSTHVFAFNYATQMWKIIKQRTLALGWNRGNVDAALPVGDPHHWDTTYCEHGDGTPGAPHSYDSYVYVPPEGIPSPVGTLLRVSSPYMYPTYSCLSSHKLTLGVGDAECKWSRASSNVIQISQYNFPFGDYDPISKKVYYIGTQESQDWNSILGVFDVATGLHSKIPLSQTLLSGGHSAARFWRGMNDDKRYLLWVFKGGIHIVDLAANPAPYAAPPTTNAGLTNFVEQTGKGLTWCAPLKCFFAKCPRPATENSAIYKITPPAGDPLAGTWSVTKIDLPGLPDDQCNGMYKRLHYDATLRCVTWFCSAGGAVYAYRPVV